MRLLYSSLIFCYGLVITMAQLFSKKAKLWVLGRKNWKNKVLEQSIKKPVIWIHAASYGEFEQGKPVIDYCFDYFKSHEIVVSFFSPSGYEGKKNYAKAHRVIYLPLDTPSNAKYFIETLQPEIALFVKYEFWYNLLQQCFIKKIPVVYFSAVFRPNQLFFKPYGTWFLKHLKQCETIFVRDLESKKLLENQGLKSVQVSGDTRFDSVYENSLSIKEFPEIEAFAGNQKVIVFGSSWPQDEAFIVNWVNHNQNVKCIIAPHEIHYSKIQELQKLFTKSCGIYSKGNFAEDEVLILDTVGMLKHVYALATINYVGGGFGKGIHNLLEAVVFGKPVVFGPKFQKFPEAFDLIKNGGGFSVQNQQEFNVIFNRLLTNSITTNRDYILQNIGATKIITQHLEMLLHKKAPK